MGSLSIPHNDAWANSKIAPTYVGTGQIDAALLVLAARETLDAVASTVGILTTADPPIRRRRAGRGCGTSHRVYAPEDPA
jgi:hypothetical protein